MQYGATTLNLAMLIEKHARQTPDKLAVVWNDMRLTYKQLNDYANKIANGLREIGVSQGDKVALSCPNLPYFPMAYFGILKAGAVVVPLNVLLKPREVAYHLKDSDAKAVFAFEGSPEYPLAATVKAGFDEVASCEHFINMQVNPMSMENSIDGGKTLTQLMMFSSDKFESPVTNPLDTAVILYTSGTTGQPKGAELTHFNMLMNAGVTRDLYLPVMDNSPNSPQVSMLITLPLFHSFGQTAQMNACLYHGGICVLQPQFDPKVVLEIMRREKVTFWSAVPTMVWALLNHIETAKIDISEISQTLKAVTTGGAPLPVEVLHAFENKFNVKILEGYGLSETAPVACFNQPDRPTKAGTVGTPILGVDIKCFDDDGAEVAPGMRGEVVIRGHNLMKGYYNKPEATAEALRNGWFHTGDIGIFDDEGYLSIVDRKKDMILRGGYNVYPRELEEILMTHPAVSLVAVIGVADERLGEEVKAFVVPKSGANITENELIEWGKNQFGAHKYPRLVEFRESLPMGATGKILKRELRDNS